MSHDREDAAPWDEILHELRRMRSRSRRMEEELWSAIDEIRLQGTGAAPAAEPDGRAGSLSPVEYARLKRRLRALVADTVPAGARAAVVSKGDDELIDLPGVRADHFPRAATGGYAGFYPPDGIPAIAHLEWVRANGTGYLIFPDTARWWLESFPRLGAHLERTAERVEHQEGAGSVYRLDGARGPEVDGWRRLGELLDGWEESLAAPPAVLDWDTGRDLTRSLHDRTVFTPPPGLTTLPYRDGTVEVVALAGDDPHRLREARRVASLAVVRVLEAGAGITIEPRAEPHGPLPRASIVIPTFNGLAHLVPCLRALEATLPAGFGGEVVVVDDGGTPETGRALRGLERRHSWLRVVRNRRNRGFIASCNRGAEESSGDYLVFLNDDTVPLAGWLNALLRTFRTQGDAGAVGGRLLFPDGRLQEAGGVIYRDGSGANFGRGDYEVDAPLYSYTRRVHYCSGALLATPRELFRALGGFDTAFRPAYYEDTDFCFSVRASGFGVYYQPEATVVHTEGATSGTDLASGAKQHQVRNRETFLQKWSRVCARLPEPPNRYTALTWHQLALTGDVA